MDKKSIIIGLIIAAIIIGISIVIGFTILSKSIENQQFYLPSMTY